MLKQMQQRLQKTMVNLVEDNGEASVLQNETFFKTHPAFIWYLFHTRFCSQHSIHIETFSPYINIKRDRTNIAILQVKKQAYRLGNLLKDTQQDAIQTQDIQTQRSCT